MNTIIAAPTWAKQTDTDFDDERSVAHWSDDDDAGAQLYRFDTEGKTGALEVVIWLGGNSLFSTPESPAELDALAVRLSGLAAEYRAALAEEQGRSVMRVRSDISPALELGSHVDVIDIASNVPGDAGQARMLIRDDPDRRSPLQRAIAGHQAGETWRQITDNTFDDTIRLHGTFEVLGSTGGEYVLAEVAQ